jgi:SAM-dependent methyltransferase
MASPTQESTAQVADAGPPPVAQLLEQVYAIAGAQMILAFAQHGIADHLADGPRSAAEIARAAGVHEDSLRRMLRSLTAHGLVEHDGPDRFRLGRLGGLLRSDDESGARDAVLLTEQVWWPFFGALPQVVATGRTGADVVYGTTFFEWLGAHPEAFARFVKAMNAIHSGEADAVAEAYDFSGARRVVDVGGGNGTGVAAVLRRNAGVEGVLFDLPQVIEGGGAALGDEAGRCELVGGDVFDAVPEGGDVYLLSHVVHDWDRERALAILRTCRDAMAPGGRLLVIEAVVPPGDGAHPAKFLDMAMLAFTGGAERTEEEYRDLLADAGLELTRVIPTRSPVSIVEAAAQ